MILLYNRGEGLPLNPPYIDLVEVSPLLYRREGPLFLSSIIPPIIIEERNRGPSTKSLLHVYIEERNSGLPLNPSYIIEERISGPSLNPSYI